MAFDFITIILVALFGFEVSETVARQTQTAESTVITTAIMLPTKHHLVSAMVNFMCQLDWTTE